MIGQLLGHYRILEKIGEGGMGVVYRAHDERLDRDVALKVLPPGTLADESARKRFRKEALALARLNHPNIEAAYDFDTQDGVDFLVMEFIPGATLSEKLAAGPLPEKEIANLGAQLAEGLAAAHGQGVIHRDLKPGNLRLTPDGKLKILDFGLAKLVVPMSVTASTASIASTHGMAGTFPYISPEQLRGEPADARADIYQTGIVLFEMATGRLPFQEKLPTALVDAILHQNVPPPGRLRADLSPRLEEIILKCLEKSPENRYQSAGELRVDLRRLFAPATLPAGRELKFGKAAWLKWTLGAAAAVVLLLALLFALNPGGIRDRLLGSAGTPIRSLAVLPLENISRDPEQEFFAEGMTEELITQLSRVSALRVISRTSVMKYKGTQKSLPEIARELNVDAVVEGSVLRAGDRVRITAQLVRASPEQHLWAQSYDRDLRDVLAVHSDVAQAVVREVRVTLSPDEKSRIATTREVNPAAHEAYLRGRYFATRFRTEPLQKAREYLEQAIALDPGYAPAYAELAHVYGKLLLGAPPASSRAGMANAYNAAKKAVELDPQSGQAHMMVAVMGFFATGDTALARREVSRALELEPKNPDVLIHVAITYAAAGRKSEALAAAEQALQLDPLSFEMNWLASQVFHRTGEYDRALELVRRSQELDPEFPGIYRRLGVLYETKRMYPEAVAAYQRWMKLIDESAEADVLGRLFAQHGPRGILLWRKQRLEAELKHGREFPVQLAGAYAALGEKEKAFQYLQRAVEVVDPELLGLGTTRDFDAIRDDPRFQEILRRVQGESKAPAK